jgi:hypothetical protein
MLSALLVGYFAADVLVAHVRWLNDSYSLMPPPISTDMRYHHLKPHIAGTHGFWALVLHSLHFSWVLLLFALLLRSQWLWWCFIFATLARSLHGLSHRTKPPRRFNAASAMDLVHSHEQHSKWHHLSAGRDSYAVVCPLTNRIPDGTGYWRRLERLVQDATDVPARTESDEAFIARMT